MRNSRCKFQGQVKVTFKMWPFMSGYQTKIIFFSFVKAHNNTGSHQKLNYLAFASKEPFCFINLMPTLHQYCDTNLSPGLWVFNYSVISEETEIHTPEKNCS